MAITKKIVKQPTKRYFIKEEKTQIKYGDPLALMLHKNCGGMPKWTGGGIIVFCGKCRRETVIDDSSTDTNLACWNRDYYTERKTEIYPEKMEPVFRSVDKMDGKKCYSTWEPLPLKDLISYYFPGKQIEEIAFTF